MPAQYVKAYIKRNKNDAADAEAICEAVSRPTMRFVPVKTAEQQATALLHRGREQLVRQRTMLVNALRAHLAEFGIVAARGLRNVGQLIAIVRDDADIRLPAVAQQVLQVLASQLEQIEAAVAALERQLLTWHKTNPVSAAWLAWCRGRIQPVGKSGWAASPSAATVICVGCSSMGQAPICCDRRRRKPIRG
jgi:transposase